MLKTLSPVDNTTLQERVYRTLKEAILEGGFSPGETLPTRSLASMLGTSVMPVRDALVRLMAEGGVEILPNRAVRIPVLTRESIAELYEIRINLEGRAAAMAAGKINGEELEAVEDAFDGMRQAAENNDVGAFLHNNQTFHFGIYRAARSYHFLAIIEALWLKGGPLLRPFAKDSRASIRLLEGHAAHATTLSGLRSGNPTLAAQGIINDLVSAGAWYEANYPEVKAREFKILEGESA
jgi:DNA-binding GntR family transcriptional regulator